MEHSYIPCHARYMIVCDRLVFLHLHKSGGTFVNQLMLKCMPSAKRLGYHLPWTELPETYRALPVVGTVRNPWAYYVSWFFFQQAQMRPNPLFQVCSDGGSLGFAGTVRNLVELHGDDDRVARLIEAFPDHFVGYGVNLTKACIAQIQDSGLGFYSFLYDRLYRDAPTPAIVRTEHLRQDIRPLLISEDPREQALIDYFLDQAPDLNTSRHDRWDAYYDDDLFELIRRRDALVISRHAYNSLP